MNNSMWRCSGEHWMSMGFTWVAVCLSVALISEFAPDDAVDQAYALAPNTGAPKFSRMSFAAPISNRINVPVRVAVEFKGLDLATIDAAAFGDADEHVNDAGIVTAAK